MPLDVDFIAAKQAIESLQKTLSSVNHGERESIANDIIEFSNKMKVKYSENINSENILLGQSTII